MKETNMTHKFYVYTLAHPDGTVFYVGKGSGNRMFIHTSRDNKNKLKVATIRSIEASGGEVQRSILAYFESEMNAYMYEWALMNMTTYAETLTNVNRGECHPVTYVGRPGPKPIINEPYKHNGSAHHWGCFVFYNGKIYHEVVDIKSFARCHKVDPFRMVDLANGVVDRVRHWTRSEQCPSRIRKSDF
jgi:hypothetical protein